ncbi:hypothetical protein Q3G72_016696 [Acer saccharum]|nr:hypothetical protein Q3G72_016696 [Acer saccharum]
MLPSRFRNHDYFFTKETPPTSASLRDPPDPPLSLTATNRRRDGDDDEELEIVCEIEEVDEEVKRVNIQIKIEEEEKEKLQNLQQQGAEDALSVSGRQRSKPSVKGRRNNEPLQITYSYWDGAGHGRVIQDLGEFLQAVQQQLPPEFREIRTTSMENLLYVKEDLIIPHQHGFYELILNKAKGKSGPAFKNASVPTSAQASFSYIFAVSESLQIDQEPYQSTFYNATIEVAGANCSIQSVFLITLGIVLLILLGLWIHGQVKQFFKKTKKAPKVEVETATSDDSMNE